jgi:hypothetical protein
MLYSGGRFRIAGELLETYIHQLLEINVLAMEEL